MIEIRAMTSTIVAATVLPPGHVVVDNLLSGALVVFDIAVVSSS